MRVGIITNRGKPAAQRLEEDLLTWLAEQGVEARAAALGPPAIWPNVKDGDRSLPPWAADCDIIMVLGGDGTLLKAARLVAPTGVPLLGINLGHLGFITELEVDGLFDQLTEVLGGRVISETRSMLQCQLVDFSAPTAPSRQALEEARLLAPSKDDGGAGAHEGSEQTEPSRALRALNDVVITKGSFARLIHLDLFVDGTYVTSYPADGLIISTPTGSTAYSLAAGGPIVHPNVDVMVLTPICAHTLYSRPLVVSASETVHVRVRGSDSPVVVTADGQDGLELEPRRQLVEVTRAPESVSFLRRPGWSFYELLREKFHEGRRGGVDPEGDDA